MIVYICILIFVAVPLTDSVHFVCAFSAYETGYEAASPQGTLTSGVLSSFHSAFHDVMLSPAI